MTPLATAKVYTRARWLALLGCVASLVTGALVTLEVLIASDGTGMRAPSTFLMLTLLVGGALTPGASGFFLGLSLAPARVRDAGRQRVFGAACALIAVALPCALLVQLFFITWPLAALLIIGATLLFRRSLR